jgi:hypothetical protein
MFPTQSPFYFPPTTRRPTGNTVPPSFRPSFKPSNVPTNTPSYLDIQAIKEPTRETRIVSYSIVQNNDLFIPVKAQYAVVALSSCLLIALILLCIVFYRRKNKEKTDLRVIKVLQPIPIQDVKYRPKPPPPPPPPLFRCQSLPPEKEKK